MAIHVLGLFAMTLMGLVLVNRAMPLTSEGTRQPGPLSAQEDMVRIPAGEFTMGSNDGASDEKPLHTVYLDAYSIDRYEVTNEQYKQCVEDGKCQPPRNTKYYEDPEYGRHPVVYVNWYQALAYCGWAEKRLPTEAEWEKAARGTDSRVYPWGNEWDPLKANVLGDADGFDGTAPVGKFEGGQSPYGAYDMAGNVWEWVDDWYDKGYYKERPDRNPKGPSHGKFKILRGGSWRHTPKFARTAERLKHNPKHLHENRGFRCAKTP
jgi:formylglycine-generating enzyme required for sulfatase activity